jgi:hypothetical protein
MTTRGRNFGVRDSLGDDFGSLPAVLLGQGMLRFHTGILTTVSLADDNRDAPRLHWKLKCVSLRFGFSGTRLADLHELIRQFGRGPQPRFDAAADIIWCPSVRSPAARGSCVLFLPRCSSQTCVTTVPRVSPSPEVGLAVPMMDELTSSQLISGPWHLTLQ